MGFPGQRDSTRSAVNPHNEDALQRHYVALKSYLAPSLQDEQGRPRPNRARDKLLRLSVTQFMELSTDVYDKLIRREDERLQRVREVPRCLPPKQNFHPKRNQARQKLSTLPIERFRQLATDVYFELERRIPRFANGDLERPRSGASSRAPSRGGMRPPPGAIRVPPPGAGGRPPLSPGPNGGPARPLPRTFQANTMVPNKSTMVEDDDGEDEDEFGLDNVVSGLARRDTNLNGDESERIRIQDAEIEDLKDKLLQKDLELGQVKTSGSEDLSSLREELEQKHMDAQKLNNDLRRELDQLHKEKAQDEREIRAQHDRNLDDVKAQLDNAHRQINDVHSQLETHQTENRELRTQLEHGEQQPSDSELQRRIELLEQELTNQEKLTKEVRDEATMLLQEMRELSKQNDEAIEQEEKLAAQVSKLEREVDNWRQRYAKVKAQNKHLRASHMGLGLETSFDAGSLLRKEGLINESGLVKDIDVTRFQLAIEELLKVARQSSTDSMLDNVKNVAISVQSITSVVGTDGYPTPNSSSPDGGSAPPADVAKLKARVTGTANSLITQTKLHASASGLSPVALLDAAASNLTAAVVELIKAIGIRPSPKSELEDVQIDPHESMGSFYEDRESSDQDRPFEHDDPISPVDGDGHNPQFMVSPPEQKSMGPVPVGSIGRNNTFKKMNGWFGWGKSPEMPATSSLNGGGTEYEPYS